MRKNQTRKDLTTNSQAQALHPLLQEIIIRLNKAGEVVAAPDGHLFFRPGVHVKCLFGAMDMKKEGEKYGVRIVVRKVRKRATKSKYGDMPWFQIYILPIVKKNAKTMTENERRNMEMNRQALLMAHAVERDPEQVAAWRERHEAHKRNPEGYAKLYPNLFGFLVATFRKELETQEMRAADAPLEVAHTEHRSASDASVTDKEKVTGVRLCVPRQMCGIGCAVNHRRSPIVLHAHYTHYTNHSPRAA